MKTAGAVFGGGLAPVSILPRGTRSLVLILCNMGICRSVAHDD
jgi:hypothetical protein